MRALVIYESMYGNTRSIAEAIAEGLRQVGEVDSVPVAQADEALEQQPDLVVLGGPTHAHGMSRASTRQAAVADASKPDNRLTVDPHAHGPGVRDLLESITTLDAQAAAFDTRLRAPAWLTGRAAKGIARGLQRRGASLVAPPESFLVEKDNRLVAGEIERARQWGADLARARQDGGTDTEPTHKSTR
jgi:hypothetical protein